jgi:hypothetical protein
MDLTFLEAIHLIAATERVGREPGDDLRAALGIVAAAALTAPNPSGEGAQFVAGARVALTELRDAAVARDRDAVGRAWGRIRFLLRERSRAA